MKVRAFVAAAVLALCSQLSVAGIDPIDAEMLDVEPPITDNWRLYCTEDGRCSLDPIITITSSNLTAFDDEASIDVDPPITDNWRLYCTEDGQCSLDPIITVASFDLVTPGGTVSIDVDPPITDNWKLYCTDNGVCSLDPLAFTSDNELNQVPEPSLSMLLCSALFGFLLLRRAARVKSALKPVRISRN